MKIDSFSRMSLQTIQDNKGKATGVFIPINEWKALKKRYKNLEELEHDEPSKKQLLSELKEAVVELKALSRGRLNPGQQQTC